MKKRGGKKKEKIARPKKARILIMKGSGEDA